MADVRTQTPVKIVDPTTNSQEAAVDSSGNLTVKVNAAIAAGTNLLGKVSASNETATIYSGSTALTPKFAAFGVASSGDNTLVSAVVSNKIRVLSLMAVVNAAVNIYFTAANGGTVIFGGSTNKITLAANSGFVLPFNPIGWFETDDVNKAVVVNLSTGTAFSGGLVYVEV